MGRNSILDKELHNIFKVVICKTRLKGRQDLTQDTGGDHGLHQISWCLAPDPLPG